MQRFVVFTFFTWGETNILTSEYPNNKTWQFYTFSSMFKLDVATYSNHKKITTSLVSPIFLEAKYSSIEK